MAERKINETERTIMLQLKASLDVLHTHLTAEPDSERRDDFAQTASSYVLAGLRTVTGVMPPAPTSPIVGALCAGLEAFAAALRNEPKKESR